MHLIVAISQIYCTATYCGLKRKGHVKERSECHLSEDIICAKRPRYNSIHCQKVQDLTHDLYTQTSQDKQDDSFDFSTVFMHHNIGFDEETLSAYESNAYELEKNSNENDLHALLNFLEENVDINDCSLEGLLTTGNVDFNDIDCELLLCTRCYLRLEDCNCINEIEREHHSPINADLNEDQQHDQSINYGIAEFNNNDTELMRECIVNIPFQDVVETIDEIIPNTQTDAQVYTDRSHAHINIIEDDAIEIVDNDPWFTDLDNMLNNIRYGIDVFSFELFNQQTEKMKNEKLKDFIYDFNDTIGLKYFGYKIEEILNKNHKDYIYNCKIDLCAEKTIKEIAANIKVILDDYYTKLTEVKQYDKVYKDRYNAIETPKTRECSSIKSKFTFYDKRCIQMLYLAFVTHNCLEYNSRLACYVLKESLWGIHVYMSEFYFYIIWKLKRLNIEENIENDNLCYTEHLMDEIDFLNVIMDLYHKTEATHEPVMIGELYHAIEKFRGHILSYLETFHAMECSTTLYYLAFKMRDSIYRQSESNMVNECKPKTLSSSSNWNPLNIYKSKKGTNRIEKRRYTSVYISICSTNQNTIVTKTTIFALAFTLDLQDGKLKKYNLDAVKKFLSINPRASVGEFFYTHIFKKQKNNLLFTNYIVQVVIFIDFIRTNKVGAFVRETNQKHLYPFSIDKMVHELEKYSREGKARKLILYRDLMLLAMGQISEVRIVK